MVKYRSVRYIFYVVVKFINLRFIIRIKLVLSSQKWNYKVNGYRFTFFFHLFFLLPISAFFAEKVNPRWLQLNLFFCFPHVLSQSTMLGILTYVMAPR